MWNLYNDNNKVLVQDLVQAKFLSTYNNKSDQVIIEKSDIKWILGSDTDTDTDIKYWK